jgi:tetratricopeptide (TPR) repeat protein
MNEQQTSRLLAQWAVIFREEGDTETADAIDLQLEKAASRTLSEEDADWLRRVLARARSFERKGEYADAVDSHAEALRVVEEAFGACHPETFEHLSGVARCRFNAGHYDTALEDYGRLLRLVEDMYGSEHALVATARHYMGYCRRGIRDMIGTLRLDAYMSTMLRHSQGTHLIEGAARADRMRKMGRRLAARGRRAAAIRLHDAAIALRLRHAAPDAETAFLDIHGYAMDLKDAGEPGKAANVLNQLVAARNRKSAWSEQAQGLRAVLLDSAACLSAHGDRRSAEEAAALAASIARRDADDSAADGSLSAR